jgi:ribosomal-protein-alanine N-acetyltransferase
MARALAPATMATTHAAAFTQSRPWSEAEFADLLDNRLTFTVGDERCFAVVRVIVDEAELLTIATHPDHQRQGLARAVMKTWMELATQRGADTAFLDVAADNAPACDLYQLCGFSICGNRSGYYRRQNDPAVDAVLMRRALSAHK